MESNRRDGGDTVPYGYFYGCCFAGAEKVNCPGGAREAPLEGVPIDPYFRIDS